MITYLRAPRRCLRSSRWGCPTWICLSIPCTTAEPQAHILAAVRLFTCQRAQKFTSVPDEGEGIVSSFANLSTGCRAIFLATQILPQSQAHNRIGSDSIGPVRLTTSLLRNSTTKSRTSSAFEYSYDFVKVLPTATGDPHFLRRS